MGQQINIPTSGTQCIGAYLAQATGKPKGGLVVIQEIYGVNAHMRSVVDRFAGLGYTAIAPAGRIGTVGYCWGGTVALLAALRLGLPSVSYYGARNLPFLHEVPKASVLFHFGEKDQHITPEMVQKHREALPQMEVYTYPADHAFNRDGSAPYHEASAKLALQRTLAFFEQHLAST